MHTRVCTHTRTHIHPPHTHTQDRSTSICQVSATRHHAGVADTVAKGTALGVGLSKFTPSPHSQVIGPQASPSASKPLAALSAK